MERLTTEQLAEAQLKSALIVLTEGQIASHIDEIYDDLAFIVDMRLNGRHTELKEALDKCKAKVRKR